MKKPPRLVPVDDGVKVYNGDKLLVFVPLDEHGKVAHLKAVADTIKLIEWKDL